MSREGEEMIDELGILSMIVVFILRDLIFKGKVVEVQREAEKLLKAQKTFLYGEI